ncbi:MAG: bifunctional pyr operon transcriptional regulator/uracil phosphoribosyltransferase PyrR [Desulfuromonadales bacterium]|nr:bifunctional pyr operon transcriptional regulator/uracil phosphoribosyltransferase PyrR [Desulfuromonadales bacterium]MDT8423065.1 bifunctional pyr operon transcriptional regulator/uracil phosphoribosyltransferase PyrR [Desulfuromonadales bacterium]
MAEQGTLILDKAGVRRALTRIAHEIIERNKGVENVALVGIRSGGDDLAKLLARQIAAIENIEVPLGTIDITMYRDDLDSRGSKPIGKTEIPFSLDDMKIVLVDDVLFTGRTIRAAMDALMDLGRPRAIQLSVLIDRGHRELPIRPDFVGRNLPTAINEKIDVVFDGERNPLEVRLIKS